MSFGHVFMSEHIVVSRFYYDYSGLNDIFVMQSFVLKGIMTLGLYVCDIW